MMDNATKSPQIQCKALENLQIEKSRVHLYTPARILVQCRKDKSIRVEVIKSASFIPQPPCHYSINFTNSDVLAEISRLPTYTKRILLTQEHINTAFTLHNSTDWHTKVDYILETALIHSLTFVNTGMTITLISLVVGSVVCCTIDL